VHRDRGIERKVVVLALVGIAALTALVIVAWKFGGGDNGTPSVVSQHQTPSAAVHELVLTGAGGGTYLEVRRTSARGPLLLQATVPRGEVHRFPGTRFWLFVRQPRGVHVSLGGKPVALPARRNLKVVVTPTRTSRAGY
jgi:hypothetical protein